MSQVATGQGNLPAAVVPCQAGMQRADAMVSDGLLASAPETLEDTIAYLGSAYGGAAGYARAVGLNADEVRPRRIHCCLATRKQP